MHRNNLLKYLLWVFLLFTTSFLYGQGKPSNNDISRFNDSVINAFNNRVNAYEQKLLNETIVKYQQTNDKINTHINYISLIATIFGVIIALASIFLGFESLRSYRRKEEAIKTLEEAKKYVENKKVEFDKEIEEKRRKIEEEQTELIKFMKAQFLQDVNAETSRIRDISIKKAEEIQGYSPAQEKDERIEALTKRLAFFENVGIPDDPDILISKAKLLGEKGMHLEAIEILYKVINIEEKNAKALWRLGWEYLSVNNNEKAMEVYQKYIELDQSDSTAFNNLGVAFIKLERLHDALKNYDKAIALNSKSEKYYANKIIVLRKLNSPDEVIETMRKRIEEMPEQIAYHSALINELKAQEKVDKAILEYDTTIKLFPSDTQELNLQKAAYLLKMDKYDDAAIVINALLDTNYKPDISYNLQSLFFEKTGALEKALESIEKSIVHNPLNEDVLTRKGELIFQRSPADSLKYFCSKSKEIESEKLAELGAKIFSKNNMYDKAKELYALAISIMEPKLENEKEGDILNYFEALILVERYDDAKQYGLTLGNKIKSTSYVNVFNFLEFVRKIFSKEKQPTLQDFLHFNKINPEEKSSWNFEDILNSLPTRLPNELSQPINTLVDYLKNNVSYSDYDKLIRDKVRE